MRGDESESVWNVMFGARQRTWSLMIDFVLTVHERGKKQPPKGINLSLPSEEVIRKHPVFQDLGNKL